jgi:CheY-like chemotaxis protein
MRERYTRLQQVVWNLLANAVKFTPAGGWWMFRTRRISNERRTHRHGFGHWHRRDISPFVFDRFRQADVSSTRGHTGLGLGLAIVRHLVGLHGGLMRRGDAATPGTRFIIQLPRGRVSLTPRAMRGPAPVAAAARNRAARFDGPDLIVDDDRESCEMMREPPAERLRAYGASATEAIKALAEFNPDLVLSDIACPTGTVRHSTRGPRDQATLGRHMPSRPCRRALTQTIVGARSRRGLTNITAKPVSPALHRWSTHSWRCQPAPPSCAVIRSEQRPNGEAPRRSARR